MILTLLPCLYPVSPKLCLEIVFGEEKSQVTETFDENKEPIPIKKEKMGVFHRYSSLQFSKRFNTSSESGPWDTDIK